MITLEASRLRLSRGGRSIVDDVSMRAAAGDFVAVIGPNGAGKSTLLSMLAGLLEPDAGSVSYNGTPLATLSGSELARRRSYLPQNPRCEWPISVERLVALGLTPTLPALGGSSGVARDRVRRALEECDLADRSDQSATSLSGGELARAMLARALVSAPDVLIVDEPLTGLDPRHLIDAVRRLRAYARTGKLVVAAVHDLTLAARYTTHAIALHNGRVARSGVTQDVLTADVMRSVFGVNALVMTTPHGPYIDCLDT